MTTATTIATKPLTAADLLRLYSEGVRGELIQGEFHATMSTGVTHGKVVINMAGELRSFIRPRRLGSLMGSDTGVLLERDPDTVREPDIAYISADRMPLGADVPGYSEVIPDLVVEVASPSDTPQQVEEKARMWLSYGVRLVWTAHPSTRTVNVYPQSGARFTLAENDILDGDDVLPGFSWEVSDIFDV